MSKQVQFETELSIDELKKLQRLAKQRKMSLANRLLAHLLFLFPKHARVRCQS